jgi:hypothetical protein
MPIPKPTPTEEADRYIDRCMSDENMNTDYPDQKQRYAVCLVTYEKQAQKNILAQETFTDYPVAATTNAKRALKWREETGNPRGCGTPVGWARANQLANREPLSFNTVKRMAAFIRHEQYSNVPYEEGCGGLSYDLWGGAAGVNWAIRKVKSLEA